MTNPELKIEMRAIDSVFGYEKNSRLHSDSQVEQIANSIREFGFVNPVLVDPDSKIIAGHGRAMASRKLGLETIPVIQLGHLSKQQIKALRISDNKLAENSSWNFDMLRVELNDLALDSFDLSLIGFDDASLVQFMAFPSEGDPEAVPEPPVDPVTRTGDVWLLGKHRLLCGDSTNAADVAKVLDGKKPNLMVTDPPYGVEYDAGWRNRVHRADGTLVGGLAVGKVSNDDRSDWREAWALFPGNVTYVWHAGMHSASVFESLLASGFVMRAQIIWSKSNFAIGRGDYHWQHEPCWYAVRKGKAGGWSGDRKQTTVWEIDKPQKSETGHSTQKPIECMKRPMENNSKPGDYVYEPFCGSATTIIAGEMTNRSVLAIEISPTYCDVGVLRWMQFTKQDAVLEGDGRTFAEIARERQGAKGGDIQPGGPQPEPARSPAASPG